jgi:hypothetical protein
MISLKRLLKYLIHIIYKLDGLGFEPQWEEKISHLHANPDRPWGLPNFLYNRHRGSFLGIKRPARSVDHPPHIGPRNEQSYTSTPPLRLHGMYWENFTITLI